MKKILIGFIFTMLAFVSIGQVQWWQIERADTTDVGGSVYRFGASDTTTGVFTFLTRNAFANVLYGDSVAMGVSNRFENEIEVNIVRAINNDSIVLFLDTLSYNDNPDYVLGFHNVAVSDTVIRGTIKLIPKDSVSTLDIGVSFQEQTQNQIISANQAAADSANKRSSWALFIALFSVVFSVGFSLLPQKDV